MRNTLKSAKKLANSLALVILLVTPAASSKGADWQIEAIDQAAKGSYASLKADKSGNLHVAYVLEDGYNTLKYGFWDHSLKRWFVMPIARSAFFCSLALDSKQLPHVSWDNGKLWYAHWDGDSWKKQAIPIVANDIGFYTSIGLGANDNPAISFYEYEGAPGTGFVIRLRAVMWNGSFWQLQTADPTPGSGKFNALVVDSKGRPNIAYGNVKYEGMSLRYASWDGHAWKYEFLEGGPSQPFAAQAVNVVLDQSDNPHIAYTDAVAHVVKYATRHNGKWEFEVVDSLLREGFPDRNGIALDSEGNPYISYFDQGAGMLKVAHRTSRGWVTEVVDQNYAGYTSSIQVTNDSVWVVYSAEQENALKFARRSLDQGDLSVRKPSPQTQNMVTAAGAPEKQ
jgi:hypothetical protein